MKRRNFLKASSSASIALSTLIQNPTSGQTPKVPKDKLLIFQTNWGFEGTNDQFLAKSKKEGYDGMELWWPDKKEDQDQLLIDLKKQNMKVGFLCGGDQTNPAEHLAYFKKTVLEATNFGIKPMYINCHSGKDYFTTADNQKFIDFTIEVATKTGITVCNETHRGRMMFAAHITKDFLAKNPQLKLTADLSHWCNVHESLLEDQAETMKLALERTEHIHARVGHQEGPQVNDPRANEWKIAFDTHLKWWDTVVERKAKANQTVTILTEFGPPSYLPTVPFTNMPLANQWEINVFMLKLLRERYS